MGDKLVILIDLSKIMQRGELRRLSDLTDAAEALGAAQ
jgi:hypothetical protein